MKVLYDNTTAPEDNFVLNYEIFEFADYDSMDDFIISKLYEDGILKRSGDEVYKGEITVKVWKKGIITDLDNKQIKTKNSIWKYNQIKRKDFGDRRKNVIKDSFIDVCTIIWNVYEKYYSLKTTVVNVSDINFSDFYYNHFLFIDENPFNTSLNNIKLCKKTLKGTKEFPNHNNYFEFDLEIPNDEDGYIAVKEPVVLVEYPDFEIYKNGQIVDCRGISKIRMNKKGYQIINYKGKQIPVHRLVAMAYLKNKYSYKFINHIDWDRSNNRLENLEWINNSLNTLHGRLRQPSQTILDSHSNEIRLNKKPVRVCLTSKNYREFVRRKIYQEIEMDVKYWIFSNSEPFFLFYVPYRKSLSYFKYPDLLNPKLNKFHKIEKGVLKGLKIDEQRNVIVDLTNRFYSPKSSSDHIINLLKLLGIDFDLYFDWLFNDLKRLVNDDVGFIYFNEFHRYCQILQMSDKVVYEMNIEKAIFDKNRWRNHFEDSETFQNNHNLLFNITSKDRVVESLNLPQISNKDEKELLNNYFYRSFFINLRTRDLHDFYYLKED